MTTPDPGVLADYLVRTRWFSGKGRDFTVSGVREVGELPGRTAESPHVVVHLVEVGYADAEGGSELYQVPLALYPASQPRLEHALVGEWVDDVHGPVHAYDALHDREAMACWLRSFDEAADGRIDPGSDLAFHRLPGHDLDLTTHSTLFSGEQSNSSVAFGDDAIMKVFRKVTPGVNPDIQIHEVLTGAGSEHVAPLYGWLDVVLPADDDGAPESQESIQLAMLQGFLRTATDGWELALASVRTLFAEPDQHATDSGGDFAGEATRLGEALAHVHADLAAHFPTRTLSADETAELSRAMVRRLDAAVGVVPELGEHAPALRAVFERVAGLPGPDVQRIHGDLHLGQTLRTAHGWKIVDFEGEPAKPLAERLLPDSPWRDVAGMLRSFDYAPRTVLQAMPADDPEVHDLRRQRADEWAHRNRNHFLVAYHATLHQAATAGELSDDERVLLDAYVADKAVYECVYEARNRPSWVEIPLAAVRRIGAA